MSSNSIARQNNNGSLPYGFIDEAVASLTSQGIEATRHTIAGKIVAIGTHCLNKDVTQHQIEYIKIKEEEGQQRNDRKRKAQNDKKHKEDPALAKTLTALKDQWNEKRNRLSPTYTPEYYLPSTITDELQPLPLPPPPAAAAIFDNENGNDSAE